MIIKKGRFLIRFEEIDKDYINRFDFDLFEKKYLEIKTFYMFKEELPLIKICFLYSPEEFLFFTGREFKDNWMCATVGYNTTINIFSPSVIEKYTIHKKDSILGTLAHELSHLFYGYSKFVNLPLFNEGIAKYHKNNVCNNKINFKIPTLRGGKDSKYDYGVGHLIVCLIMKHFKDGNKRLIKFLNKVSQGMSEEELFKLFDNVFGKDIDTLIQLEGGIRNELRTS